MIEMTTFAIPTFLITFLKFIAVAALVWLVVGSIGMMIYSWSVARAIERQMKIDAEIDRLHK
jgi:hypothetical protein